MVRKIIIGLFAGIICGLFGTGGGMILVPGFMYLLKIDSKKSRATSICCTLVMVIICSVFYYKNNYINWNMGILCAIGGVIGGCFGAKMLKKVPDYILKCIFILFLIYSSCKIIF